MSKRLICSVLLGLWVGQASASTSAEYNIAKGLAPAVKDQSIAVLKPFAGDFRILGSKIYTHDEQAKFSPIDYAVSWGMFAEPEIARRISVNQYDRFLNWKIDKLPVPPKQAMQMVSNMHIIPANPKIAQEIKKVKRGDLVRLHGELVEVKDKDLVWTSSLTPTDLGEGACELFRVNSIQWIEKVRS
ncbi:hypothetical protein NVT87_00420 [Acinetobacter radioresistens]|jgi:hypothetical protein|uniref:Uncharacterized protein n=2 Tax=Acinetobacter radioresistens TaxID=40216 RepID=A0A2T1J244_ACIRA|nr:MULTISPECIES: hypothetical protein [Acinetobacter]EET82393.1 hypothetical protein ACIRA0001_3080 [Acinetobacter radioresistens SK82]EEY85752.1 hypothetical protein HMPREF0018_02332 [Acinetobacter radioresistens SH164]EJO34202.1 hypothetical protein ACINWCA157_2856 [Acinetobacter radioresistens WC-A-157]ENV85702.1 hypothetical protein F940_01929 [Acinetobacter radioresistens NIPH 2130]ENV90219.1 hypothetical protein F939_00911 [Acinetobacter radioresistens DSM 6976 = NBRC 102413 = CIP 103788